MYTIAWKHRFDKYIYWYLDAAETINNTNAHYDLGAGGRGLTTDCHDGTNTAVHRLQQRRNYDLGWMS